MIKPLVLAQNIGIKFRPPPQSIFQMLAGRRKKKKSGAAKDGNWALRDISIQIDRGEAIGLLGHNGAGKSTFLRLLSGAYHPSKGTLETTNDIVAIMDLKAGMDASATGYQNIRLLAALRGIPSKNLEALNADVEKFSELGDALSLPLKSYSKGMKLRLAFALATSKESELLLLDEAIGVGDAAFKKKAKTRLKTLMKNGGSLVMASHSNSYLRKHCTRGLVFDHGSIVFDGPIEKAIEHNEANLSQ